MTGTQAGPGGPRGMGAPRGSAERLAQRPMEVPSRSALPAVWVKSATAYPLLYRKRIARVDAKARPGDLVAIWGPREGEGEDAEPRPLGYGIYNPKSEIAVRVVRRGGDPPDGPFVAGLLDRAVALRRDALRLDDRTDAYRVVHAEADGLSGLAVDRFGPVLSAEAFSLGMYLRGASLLEGLASRLGAAGSVLKPSPAFVSQEGYDVPVVRAGDVPEQVTIKEHGVRYRVRFEGSHKTGFFCDQRDNRRMLAERCRDRSVLDLCCYTGGFAVAAKVAGASEVTAVDLDAEPLEVAKENANLNQARVKFVQADVFTYARDRLALGHRYEVVVLDPPKLIRTRAEIEEGTRKHFDLNRLAMQLVAPGGLLLTCSCSGLLGEAEFLKLVLQASRQSGPELPERTATGRPRHAARAVQVLARAGAGADHPVSPLVPETEYLKAVWLRLE